MLMTRRNKASGLLRNERGTSAIEIGLAAPVLAILLVGVADFSRGFSEAYALQGAASRTVERANLGTSTTDYSFLRDEAAAAAGVPVANVVYEPKLYCDGTERSSFDDNCAEGQEIARYIQIRINKDFVPSFSWFGANIPLSGEAGVRIQ
jgi:Flp pilus assembly pilin Flp